MAQIGAGFFCREFSPKTQAPLQDPEAIQERVHEAPVTSITSCAGETQGYDSCGEVLEENSRLRSENMALRALDSEFCLPNDTDTASCKTSPLHLSRRNGGSCDRLCIAIEHSEKNARLFLCLR